LESAFDGTRLAVDQTNVTEDHTFALGLGAKLVELGIEFGEFGNKLFTRSDGGKGRGN